MIAVAAPPWPAGLDRFSLGQAAQLTGIAKSNLSRYRSGALQPGPRVRRRLGDAAAAEHPARLARLTTLPRYAAAIGRELAGGRPDPVWLVRLARQVLADAAQVESPGDRRAFLGAPARLAPPLWNAFVGALAAICAHNAFDCAEPSWSGQPQCFLRTPLSPFEDLSADRLWWDWVNTPPEFAARKVILGHQELQWI